MSKIEFEPVAYKYRAKKDGVINEFVAIKDISVEEAENKIKDFLQYFKIISIKKEILIEKKEPEIYSSSTDRWGYIVEFMKEFPEFDKQEYVDFMVSKGLKFKSFARANDDFHALQEWGLIKRSSYHKWEFIASEESVNAILGEKSKGLIFEKKIVATIPNPRERTDLMYKNMADKEYFTINVWADFMAAPPNNYEKRRIKNNFYHDIDYLKVQGKLKEIKKEDGISYIPKRYRIIKVEQPIDEKMIKDQEGQKVLLETIE